MNKTTLSVCIASLGLLAACGSEQGPTNYGYGYEYNQVGETGTRVRYGNSAYIDLATIETVFRETEACVGQTATGPLLIFVPSIIDAQGIRYRGMVHLDTGTVLINEGYTTDHALLTQTMRHEFIHYILYQNGLDSSHQSPMFSACEWL